MADTNGNVHVAEELSFITPKQQSTQQQSNRLKNNIQTRFIEQKFFCYHMKKGKVHNTPLREHRRVLNAHLPLLGLEPIGGEPPMSVTRGQCDARHTVTFPATRYHRPLAGTKY